MQSDTWALTPADGRPWLLMLWMVSWQQTPCGSLPANEELIAARIGMPLDEFMKKRQWLMRGWWSADDGRMYHDVIVLRVQEMLEKRRSDADRKALNRAKNRTNQAKTPPESPQMSHGTPAGLQQESTVSPPPVPVPVPEPVITKEESVCVNVARTHTLPDSFKAECQASRPDLDPEIVWGVFSQKVVQRDQTIAVWKSWIARERPPAVPATSGNPAITTPGPRGPEPALVKLDQDAQRAVPIPAEIRRQLERQKFEIARANAMGKKPH